MNVLTRAIAAAHGLYDSADPARLPGCAQLVTEKIRGPIGGAWEHRYADLDHRDRPAARTGIVGHGLQHVANAWDTARLGHLWLNQGRWNGRSVVPAADLAAATRTNADSLAPTGPEDRSYGLSSWTNDHGRRWPDLPRDLFGAWGAQARYVWVSPAMGLLMVLCRAPRDDVAAEADLIRLVLAAAGRARLDRIDAAPSPCGRGRLSAAAARPRGR